jgi:hypothetical protein
MQIMKNMSDSGVDDVRPCVCLLRHSGQLSSMGANLF